MGEEQEQQGKPEEQPEQQEQDVPEVEIDDLLGDVVEKNGRHQQEGQDKARIEGERLLSTSSTITAQKCLAFWQEMPVPTGLYSFKMRL